MYDVIVAGAGPAGNIAALRLAGLGHNVLVLDSRTNVGDKLCTGIVGKECVERYPPEAGQIYRAARSATVVAPSGATYRVTRSGPEAYIIDRVAFVSSIARRASDSGATYRLGRRVAAVTVSDNHVGVVSTSKSGRELHTSRVVIVATGFGTPLLRMVNLACPGDSAFMVGTQVEVVAEGLEQTEVYLGESIAPGSFGWLVPLSGDRALMGLMYRGKLNGHLTGLASALQASGKVKELVEKPRQWGVPVRPIAKTYGDRVLVVGDAAGLVKPTTGGGIYYSLLSGEAAAETVQEAFVAGDFAGARLKRYEQRWKTAFGKELRVGHFARMLYEVLGDQQIEQLLSVFLSHEIQGELINSSEFSFDWHSAIILKALRQRGLGQLLRSFGPAVAPFLSRLAASRA